MIIDIHLHPFCSEAHYGDRKTIAKVMSGGNPTKLKRDRRLLDAIMEKYILEDYVAIMDKYSVDKAVIVSLNVKTAYDFFMVSNDDIAEFVSRYPNRFIGFGCIDVPAPDAMEQLEYAISSLCLKGIKLVPPAQKFDISDNKYNALWRKMVDLEIPLWTHGGHQVSFHGSIAKYGHPLLIDDLATRNEDLTIIIGHMGVPWMWDAWSVAQRHYNVYVDISAHPNLYQWFPWDAFKTENMTNKLLFASDYPLKHYSEIFSGFNKVNIDESFRNMILGKNAMKILKIK